MPIKCLLLETKDKRRFFTLVKNRKQLAECCRAFGAKMSVVKAEIKRKHILDVQKLVSALCDKNYQNEKVEFKKD
jgi:hypothetical protein